MGRTSDFNLNVDQATEMIQLKSSSNTNDINKYGDNNASTRSIDVPESLVTKGVNDDDELNLEVKGTKIEENVSSNNSNSNEDSVVKKHDSGDLTAIISQNSSYEMDENRVP